MKKILLIGFMCIWLMGCSENKSGFWEYSDKYDGKVVMDAEGNIYKLKHNIGDTYFIRIIEVEEIKKIIVKMGDTG